MQHSSPNPIEFKNWEMNSMHMPKRCIQFVSWLHTITDYVKVDEHINIHWFRPAARIRNQSKTLSAVQEGVQLSDLGNCSRKKWFLSLIASLVMTTWREKHASHQRHL